MLSICKYLISVMCSAKRADRKAFSLVEALVASLIVGYCLLPVVGTMQSGEKLTERIVHSEKLRMLARSRLNLETSAANNEQKLINTSPNYHYVYLKSGSDQLQFIDTNLAPASFSLDTSVEDVVYTYEVNVAVDDDVYLEPAVGLPAKYVRGLNGLKSLVVTAKLLPNGTDVEEELTFTLVSLITVPMVSQQHAWAIDARQNKVLSFDPYSGMLNLTKTIDFPTPANLDLRPSFVFPHPNDKTVFVYSAAGTYGLNTDNSDSTYYAGLATYTAPTTPGRFSLDTSKNTSVRNYLSRPFLMAMRPDGKYIYSMSKASDGDIFADGYASSTLLTTNPSGQSLDSTLTYSSVDTSEAKFLVAGADGNLYFGPVPKTADSTVSVLGRMPMYGLQLPKYEELRIPAYATHDIVDAAISPDGETLGLLLKPKSGINYLLTFFDSKSAASKVKSELNALTTTAITDMEYSGDGRYICLVDKNSGMYLFDTTDDDLYSSGNNLTSLPFAKAPDSMKPEYVVYSQETNSFIIDNVASFSSSVISLDCEEFAAKKYAAKIPDENIFQLAPENDSIVHVNAKKTDYIYVATSDKTSDFNIHCVDQYSGAINYDREITLPKEPYDIALTSMGEKLSVTYGDNLAKAETYSAITASRTFELSLSVNNNTVAALNEGYSKNERGNTAFTQVYKAPKSGFEKVANAYAYAFDFENTFNKQSETINMSSSWECKKIVGLNSGGFLALAGKTDGTSLIDWYGKNSVGSYTRNARWISGVTAKQYSKTLPEEMLNDTSATTAPDSWKGHIIIYHLNKFTPGSKISRISFVSDHSGTPVRYVTPVLLEDQGGGNYLVKDYGMGIAVDEIGEYEESITWKISGVIENENYYPGVWYGNPDPKSVNAGVIKFNTTPTCGFYPDIGDPTKGDTDNTPISINRSVKRKSASNRNYQIQFTAEENIKPAESFPPKFVQDLAISRDDRVLALVASDSVSQSVKFYDFAANNFGNETQLSGMVADYRMQSLDLTNSPVKPGLSHKETPGVILRDAITSNESAWTSIKNYPANYNESGVSDPRVGTDKRFFGYYSSYTKDGTLSPVKSFATATKGKTRLFADQLLSMYDAVWQRFYDNYFRINNADAHESLVQFDQAGKGERKVKQYAAASIAGYDDINTYLKSDYTKKLTNESFTVLSVPKGVDAGVFKSYRWIEPGLGRVLEFRLPINSYGNVKVDLMFCESHFSASDKRLFDISIEGKTVETNLDIYREAGGKNIAFLRTYDTEVFDGVLNIKFTNKNTSYDNLMISGIRVTYTDKNTPDLYYYCGSATDGPYTDTYGFSWNKLVIPTNAKVTDHPLTSSQITSVPDGTTKEIFKSPYLLTGSVNDFTCSIPFTGSNKADITIYYIEHYHTSAGQRKFNVYIEGEKRENELDVFVESGGAKKGFARRYSGINVTGGSIDIKFEKGSADVPLFCGVSVSYIGSTQILQNGGIFTQTDLSKLNGSVTTTGSGYAATTNMDNGWNKIASESVTPFRFVPVYMGEERINPATYLYRKMLFGRDVASPTLFLFSNRRVTTSPPAGKALEIRRVPVPLNGVIEKKEYVGLVMTDVAISEDGQNIFVSAAKDLIKINVAASLGNKERIATFSSPITHLANKPFINFKSTPTSGTITELVTFFPEARWGSNNAVVASGGIYIAGGTDSSGNALNKIYQYDVFANNLTLVATLSESLSKHSMAAYDGDIYMFNGIRNVASISDSVFKYFPESKRSIKSVRGAVVTTVVATSGAILTPRGSPGVFVATKEGSVTYSSEPDSIKKILYWRDGNGPSESYSTLPVLNAFDGNISTHWRLFGDSTSGGYRHIRIEFDIPVKVTHFSVVSENFGPGQNKFSGCILRASNSISSLALPSGGTELKNISTGVGSGVEYSVAPGTTGFYTCYRLSLLTDNYSKEGKFHEIVFKGDYTKTITTNLPDTGMHRTLDDNLASVAVTNNAACTTPYGIMVAGGYAGSGLADSSSNPGTTTALIYWPHAIGGVYEETNDKLYGISRSVPSLPEPSVDNCMVWHKGKVYCFGGTNTSGTTEFHFPFIFNFEYNTWAEAKSGILGVDKLKRRKAAAVSFGDEIFLFGGECSVTTSFAVAWNTSTNVVREVFSAPPAKLGEYNVSAAAFGSHIYLFGGRDSVSTSVGAKNGIYRFTP